MRVTDEDIRVAPTDPLARSMMERSLEDELEAGPTARKAQYDSSVEPTREEGLLHDQFGSDDDQLMGELNPV